ncbi:MAG: dTDP-4-amino-4,6-dideoxygalactose transaminase [Elusimicrobia bacterium]|nr:dTDP-4-amino-4,6-dideoxygalactose transaminase [Elusimicrobiota bacterium]
MNIPLSRPLIGRAEANAAAKVILAGAVVGRGELGLALERRMARDIGVKHALLTTSGTHALELSMAVLGLGPGDEVILPSFTFSSVANAVLRQGAAPVFCDVLEDTLNIDVSDAARRVTKRTRAIIPVHYAGVACDMDAVGRLARGHGLAVVEDAAHAVGARWRGRGLGSIGDAGCLSFHATKNITCGEGGAFLTDSDALARKAEFFREKGTNRSAFIRGEIKKYTWVSEGSSYVLSDVLAAILTEQWKRLPAINKERGELHALYMAELAGALRLPVIPEGCESSCHLFHALLPDRKTRDRCLAELKRRGIGAAFHYQPLHASPFARNVLKDRSRLPVSESVGDRLIRLPLYAGLKKKDVLRVCAALKRMVL